ncbi:hypothetical protein [Neokomagataea anthophila]|uniref:Uncharacterized protein n=1 Tax=Neokomagataea anthophila TaxID=2826925 RepID=A0ABS5E805_9PROT|nr:hypothetical protein [Neokomagataea anthophila]MBR0560027.1 hypothetical protein [Neokomagataea anthophila]
MDQSVLTEIETLAQQFVPTLAGYIAAKADAKANSPAVSAASATIISGIIALEKALEGEAAPAA